MTGSFVPDDFEVPLNLAGSRFRLEPRGPEHNDSDHRAWVSSIGHIRATPGFPWGNWPPPDGLSLEENLRDLEQHADDFRRRVGFTYTVLDTEDRVIGCVYIYPSRTDPDVTNVRSWVTAHRAELDTLLHQAVTDWLATDWPFSRVSYRNNT
ncbi:MAG: N-acetyltransferase [Solirubrobacteraceae bacterium]